MSYSLVVEWLKFWAKVKLNRWRPTIIGVTGSVGKTSFLHILDSILTQAKVSHRSSFEANSEIGLPLNILHLKPAANKLLWPLILLQAPFLAWKKEEVKYYVAEMAIDSTRYPKNMDFLLSIFVPQISVCLSVAPMHTYQFSQESGLMGEEKLLSLIAHEKSKLLKKTLSSGGWVIYNQDNPYLNQEMDEFLTTHPQYKEKALSLSLLNPQSDIYLQSSLSKDGLRIKIRWEKREYVFTSHLLLFNDYGRIFAAAAVIALKLGIPPQTIRQGLNNFHLPGRFTLLQGIRETILLDSTYNAPYSAMEKLINHFYFLFPQRPKILVLGEMRELGPLSREKHQELARLVAKLEYRYLLTIGEEMRKFFIPELKKLQPDKDVLFFKSSQELGHWLKSHLQGKEAIFFKGSQNTIFLEEAIKPLLKNKEDRKLLVRQSKSWLKKKAKFFRQLERG